MNEEPAQMGGFFLGRVYGGGLLDSGSRRETGISSYRRNEQKPRNISHPTTCSGGRRMATTKIEDFLPSISNLR